MMTAPRNAPYLGGFQAMLLNLQIHITIGVELVPWGKKLGTQMLWVLRSNLPSWWTSTCVSEASKVCVCAMHPSFRDVSRPQRPWPVPHWVEQRRHLQSSKTLNQSSWQYLPRNVNCQLQCSAFVSILTYFINLLLESTICFGVRHLMTVPVHSKLYLLLHLSTYIQALIITISLHKQTNVNHTMFKKVKKLSFSMWIESWQTLMQSCQLIVGVVMIYTVLLTCCWYQQLSAPNSNFKPIGNDEFTAWQVLQFELSNSAAVELKENVIITCFIDERNNNKIQSFSVQYW